MSLFDIDKMSADRGAPQPAAHDQLAPGAIMSKGTNSVNYATAASTTADLEAGKNGQFTIVQSGVWTPSSGALATTSDPGAGNYVSNGGQLLSQAHGLGFIPSVTGFISLGAGSVYVPMPYTVFTNSGTTKALWISLSFAADIANFYIEYSTMAYGGPFDITLAGGVKWYLMQQTSN